ncbi:putative membrane protein [Abditibacterium utsteinense]|uniref:Putative membrane protein n=1 Tax=Abditibacterium utsteinense TaxID=1960156 RepID=A0A2S8SXC1_9BACT|nr:carotenoid biosynthesis protein [Abditibacterium utsteinense]PQV65399.1 putative membrane protein [Abditibacterium utsteinense]
MNPPQFSPKSRRALLFGAIFLFINGFFVAKVPQATRPELAGVSAAFVLVLWFPSLLAMKNWLGWQRAVLVLAALGAFAVGIETFAIKTGWPYGQFSYGDKIGTKFFGVVPWTVPFSWPPLVLGAMALAMRIAPKHRLIGATLILLVFDLVLDPGAVDQKFWIYRAGGIYYGVPFSNFCGWIVSGLIGAFIFCGISANKQIPLTLISSVTLVLSFWTSVCIFATPHILWIPALVGFALLGWIWREIKLQRD